MRRERERERENGVFGGLGRREREMRVLGPVFWLVCPVAAYRVCL